MQDTTDTAKSDALRKMQEVREYFEAMGTKAYASVMCHIDPSLKEDRQSIYDAYIRARIRERDYPVIEKMYNAVQRLKAA